MSSAAGVSVEPVDDPVDDPVDNIDALVGNTPLVELKRVGTRQDVKVFAKLESFNPGGSAKDRPAQEMLDHYLDTHPSDGPVRIVESSSGNLGIALARACLLRNLEFHCVVDIRANPASVAAIRAFGGVVHMVEEPDPENGDLLSARRKLAAELEQTLEGAVRLDQYSNPDNARAHETGTMREIAEALDGEVDVLMVATSTTGTLGGCIRYLKAHDMPTMTVAVDALGSVLFGGSRGPRQIPGFGAGQVTPLSKRIEPDRVMRIEELQSVIGCRWVTRREGMLVGGSAGAVVYAYLQLERELAPGSQTVLIFHDGGIPYTGTVYDDEWVRDTCGVEPHELKVLVDHAGGMAHMDQ